MNENHIILISLLFYFLLLVLISAGIVLNFLEGQYNCLKLPESCDAERAI